MSALGCWGQLGCKCCGKHAFSRAAEGRQSSCGSLALSRHSWFVRACLALPYTQPPPPSAAAVTPKHASRLDLHSPILKPEEMEAMKHMSFRGWETKVAGCGCGVTVGGGCGVAGCIRSRSGRGGGQVE